MGLNFPDVSEITDGINSYVEELNKYNIRMKALQ